MNPTTSEESRSEQQRESKDPGLRWGIVAVLLLLGALTGALLVRFLPPLRAGGESTAPPEGPVSARSLPPSVAFAHVADARIGAAGDTAAASNQSALGAVMRAIRARPGTETPRFLVLSGEILGSTAASPPGEITTPAVEDTAPATPAAASPAQAQPAGGWQAQADSLAAVLSTSPVASVYLAPSQSLPAGFVVRLRERLRRSGVGVQDLTACYDSAGAAPGSCRAGIAGTPFVLVGYRPRLGADTIPARSLARLDTLLTRPAGANQRTVVVAGDFPPGAEAAEPPDTTSRWTLLTRPDEVVAVLGSSDAPAYDEGKYILAPPLGVADPGSASGGYGFALVQLGPSGATQRIVSHDRQTGSLSGESLTMASAATERNAFERMVTWLWNLPNNTRDLARATVMLLGLLFAFLTVAALWEVPSRATIVTTTTQTTTQPSEGDTNAAPVQQVQQTETAGMLPGGSVFQGNLARTVWSGLTGIAAVTLLTQFWQLSGIKAEALYVVIFGISFLTLLVLLAIVRGVAEALRSRVASARLVPAWDPPARAHGQSAAAYWTLHRSRLWASYLVHRGWRWFTSLRETGLVFVDTFVNVLMGQRYDANVVWEKRITADQRALVRMADLLRDDVAEELREAVRRRSATVPLEALQKGIRVSISVLAEDGTTVFYISSSARSLARRFGQKSLAWLAIYAREARWWVHGYSKDVVVFDNTMGALPGPAGLLKLSEYFEPRFRSDYEAFIIIPLPWSRSEVVEGGRRGGLHISFAEAKWFHALWPDLHDAGLPQSPPPDDVYARSFELLTELTDPTLRVVLEQALDLLGVIVSRFDQGIYENRIRGNNVE